MEEEDFNWNLASNTQLKEECERLETLFKNQQEEMRMHVDAIENLNNDMAEISRQYLEIKGILNKREGKTDNK